MNRENVLNILSLLRHLRETSYTGRVLLHDTTAAVRAMPHIWPVCGIDLYYTDKSCFFQQRPALHSLRSKRLHTPSTTIPCTPNQAVFTACFKLCSFLHFHSFSPTVELTKGSIHPSIHPSIHRRGFRAGTKFCYALTSIDSQSECITELRPGCH